jgi:serine/threonine protein kinase
MSTTRGQHLIGQEIGHCILENLIGYGGSSAVFLAHNRSTNEQVAVKVFLPRSTMDKQAQKNFYQRFLREAEATSELDHPNILSIYSYGEHHGLPYIVMPYMPGGTLSEYVARHGSLSLSVAQQYLAQIASALDYAHENGRVHCDVKPANLLLDGWGNVVLSDFGIVHLMQPDGEGAEPSMKSAETLMGTPDYISPEQALGERLDGRSDNYSLAVTFFFLLTAEPPFKAETSIAMALMHVHDTPPLPGTMRADITPPMDRIFAKALSKWPEDRYQTAGEFSAAFAEAVANASSYVYTDSEAKRRAITLRNAGSPASPTLAPVAKVKGVWKNTSKSLRIVLSVALLLMMVLGLVTSVDIFSSITNKQPQQHVISAGPPGDYLGDEQDAWPQSKTNFFRNRQYHIQNKLASSVATAFYGTGSNDSVNGQFDNFRLSVSVSELSGVRNGGDYYGIIFRSSEDELHYYLFEITASGGGQYLFFRHDGTKLEWKNLAGGTLKNSLSPNFGQMNTITIVAKGNSFTFYVNGKLIVKTVSDNSGTQFTSGEIGLYVEGPNTEVAFSNLHIK